MVAARAAVTKPSPKPKVCTHALQLNTAHLSAICRLATAKGDKALLAKRQTGQYITHLLRESLQGQEGPNFVEPFLTGTGMKPDFTASSTSSRRALE
ncbi:uncharacterized [Tachysurus ichikawai]